MGRERETERGGKRDIIRDYEAATIELTTGRGREREGERERCRVIDYQELPSIRYMEGRKDGERERNRERRKEGYNQGI